MSTRVTVLRLVAAAFLVAAPAAAQQTASVQSNTAPNKALDRANLDTTCAACADFYTFANGGWLKRTKIPAKYGEWGAFDQLQDGNETIVREIVEAAARDVKSGQAKAPSNQFKIGAYFGACMDTAAIEALGTKPIDAQFARIAAIKSSADLAAALTELEKSNGLAPFGVGAGQDFKNADRIIASAAQGGLSLPEKNYYVSQDTAMQAKRDELVKHVAAMFRLAGESDAAAGAHAKTVLAIETKFAGASMDRVAMRDPDATYHVMTVAQFDSIAPRMKWETFLTAMGAPADLHTINVSQPEFFKAMDGFLTSIPVDDWKTLLRWRLLNASATRLPKRFADEDFAFRKLFTGQKEKLPRWQTCERNTNGALGEAVGQEYVARTFTPAAKARAKVIVDNMVSVLHDQIGQLDWMSDSTKKQALIKLDAFTRKIGYPDTWRDYSKLEVRAGEYYANAQRVTAWSTARNWAKVGKPVDRSEWGMSPPTVNAYYNPLWN